MALRTSRSPRYPQHAHRDEYGDVACTRSEKHRKTWFVPSGVQAVSDCMLVRDGASRQRPGESIRMPCTRSMLSTNEPTMGTAEQMALTCKVYRIAAKADGKTRETSSMFKLSQKLNQGAKESRLNQIMLMFRDYKWRYEISPDTDIHLSLETYFSRNYIVHIDG